MKKNIKKILVIFILIISYIILNFIWSNKAFAVNQTTTTDINSIDSNQYPQIKEMLQKLKNEHPNWNFKILYTGLDWNQVIKNETTAAHGRNLVSSSKTGAWVCPTCGDTTYDTGKWKCANKIYNN